MTDPDISVALVTYKAEYGSTARENVQLSSNAATVQSPEDISNTQESDEVKRSDRETPFHSTQNIPKCQAIELSFQETGLLNLKVHWSDSTQRGNSGYSEDI